MKFPAIPIEISRHSRGGGNPSAPSPLDSHLKRNAILGAPRGLVNANFHCHTIIMRIGDFELIDPVPEFKEPHLLATLRPWIDVGNVGTLSLDRLERYTQAKDLGRLARPGRFYDFTRYRPRSYIEHGTRAYSIPSTVIRYSIREQAPDLIFAHLLEPHILGEDYIESMTELIKFLGVKRYSLVGAMYDMVPPHQAVAGIGKHRAVASRRGLPLGWGPPQQLRGANHLYLLDFPKC